MLKQKESKSCDVLVVGSGGAGLRAAISAAQNGADVLLVTKARIGHATNTYLSKAIIASSGWGENADNDSVHARDTITGGRHLNDAAIVSRLASGIPSETRKLLAWGMEFAEDENKSPQLLKIPGHSHARHLFGRNMAGSDLIMPLKKKAQESGVRFGEHLFVSSLLVDGGRICGAVAVDAEGGVFGIRTGAVILATGGFGHVFLNTNNAPGITGDGHALALSSGATLQDMEFVQFYPTTLGRRGVRIMLYERILVQDGVFLKNSRGEDILKKNGYPDSGKITRDQLAQVMMAEILEDPEQKGTIDMDLGGLSEEAARSLGPLLPSQWWEGKKRFSVTPTTHFCMGGIVVDASGESSCQGLFAAGEVAAGAHGANRLGGNALAEVIALGALAGEAAARKTLSSRDSVALFDSLVNEEVRRIETLMDGKGVRVKELIARLKEVMWYKAGIVRSRESLEQALETVMHLKEEGLGINGEGDIARALEFRNMCLVAEAVCRSALERTESRGSHFRSDFPEESDDAWLKNIRLQRENDGRMTLSRVPVSGA